MEPGLPEDVSTTVIDIQTYRDARNWWTDMYEHLWPGEFTLQEVVEDFHAFKYNDPS